MATTPRVIRTRVRKRYVAAWLAFFKRRNPYYRDVEISEQSLATLPEDDSCYEELKELFSNGILINIYS